MNSGCLRVICKEQVVVQRLRNSTVRVCTSCVAEATFHVDLSTGLACATFGLLSSTRASSSSMEDGHNLRSSSSGVFVVSAVAPSSGSAWRPRNHQAVTKATRRRISPTKSLTKMKYKKRQLSQTRGRDKKTTFNSRNGRAHAFVRGFCNRKEATQRKPNFHCKTSDDDPIKALDGCSS